MLHISIQESNLPTHVIFWEFSLDHAESHYHSYKKFLAYTAHLEEEGEKVQCSADVGIVGNGVPSGGVGLRHGLQKFCKPGDLNINVWRYMRGGILKLGVR